MIFITGDTHRNFDRVLDLVKKAETTTEDILIILGDVGINYYGKEKDDELKKVLSELPITLFCIHGNHEMRPTYAGSYAEDIWNGGVVYIEKPYPNLIFAKDGEIYDIGGKKTIVIGGAYSVDKKMRIAKNWGWWEDEQPSEKIKAYVEQQLNYADWQIDVVLSHTCPLKYEPREVFLSGINQMFVDKTTEKWLDIIEDRLEYTKWYCGHYHTDKVIDKLEFMFEGIKEFR